MADQVERHINVAVVGYGYAGKTFHAPLVANTDGLRLAMVVSSSAEKVVCDFPNVKVVPDVSRAFADPSIDLVVIATPNDTHFELARDALLAGKHAVVDKPFTTTISEAEALLALPQAKKQVLSVFQNRRWDSDFLTVRQLLEENRLGDIVHFESHFDRYRPEVRQRWRESPGPGGGIWFDLGPHLLDQALLLFGPPDSIYADIEQQRTGATAADFFHVMLKYGHKRVILHASALVAADGPRFIVHGRQASFVKYGLDTQEDALKRGDCPGKGYWGKDDRDGMLTTREDDVPKAVTVKTCQGNYLKYYEAIRDSILKETPVPVHASNSLVVMKLLELGCQSSESNKAIRLGEFANALP